MASRGRFAADELLALGLAQGQTVSDAARAAGISERTAHRRLDDPAFNQRVDQLRSLMIARALGGMSALLADAVEAVKRNLACGIPGVEVRAAQVLIQECLRVREQVELDRRLRALEEAAASPA